MKPGAWSLLTLRKGSVKSASPGSARNGKKGDVSGLTVDGRGAKDRRKRMEGFLIENEPDEDGQVSGGVYEDRVEPVLLAIRPGPVGHEMPGAGAREVDLDHGLPVYRDLPPGLEDDAPRVIRDLEDLLL
jgi:hypothetical protein